MSQVPADNAGTVLGYGADRNATTPPGLRAVKVYLGDATRTSLVGTARLGLPRPDLARRLGPGSEPAAGASR
ncbi:MAG TPA: hypothetical protein VMV93_14645 [Chloroflexota bacterium]|nr:hypothetical protein [Chloroflexota bacterium]